MVSKTIVWRLALIDGLYSGNNSKGHLQFHLQILNLYYYKDLNFIKQIFIVFILNL